MGKQPLPPEETTQDDSSKSKRFGWVVPNPRPASEVCYELIQTEWSATPAPKLVAGRPGITTIADKEDAIGQAKALKGGQVPMAILVRAKYDELNSFRAQWVAFSAMKKRGEAEAEQVALKDWLIQVGKGAVEQRRTETVPIMVTSSDRTTTMAVDLHQSYTDGKIWETVVGQHRREVWKHPQKAATRMPSIHAAQLRHLVGILNECQHCLRRQEDLEPLLPALRRRWNAVRKEPLGWDPTDAALVHEHLIQVRSELQQTSLKDPQTSLCSAASKACIHTSWSVIPSSHSRN